MNSVQKNRHVKLHLLKRAGTPGRVRTYGLKLRSLLLYPAELPGHVSIHSEFSLLWLKTKKLSLLRYASLKSTNWFQPGLLIWVTLRVISRIILFFPGFADGAEVSVVKALAVL